MDGRGDLVVRGLARFGADLRRAGLEVGPGRLQDALRALDHVDLRRRDDVRVALACTLVGRAEDRAPFDDVFAAWFDAGGPADEAEAPDRADRGRSPSGPAPAAATARETRPARGSDEQEPEPAVPTPAWSPHERLRRADLATLSAEELRQLRGAAERIARTLPQRRSRRLEPDPAGRVVDPRETLRRAMRHAGEPLERRSRAPRSVDRRLVFLCDVSGSMAPYARALVLFLQAAVAAGRHVEAFTFGTRLTRLTPFLEGRDPELALARAAAAVPDWAGGTRIGEALERFNDGYGRRGLTRGALVVIASDGWERGDPALLAGEMARLRRRARAVVWVNPLKGMPGYQPTSGGMAAALPHVDVFLPGHDLASIEALADALRALGGPGTPRRVREAA